MNVTEFIKFYEYFAEWHYVVTYQSLQSPFYNNYRNLSEGSLQNVPEEATTYKKEAT